MSEDKTRVEGNGNPYAKIAIIGESPSYDELRTKRAFTGPAGKLLDSILKDAGINRADCWVTNACKYFVTPEPKFGRKIPFKVRAKNDGIDLQECYNELQVEINNIKPNIIIALGGTSLYAVSGKSPITDYRGSILSGIVGTKVIGTFHPAMLLHTQKDYWQKYIIQFDFVRALKQSYFPEIIRPSRILRVAKSSADLYDFISRKKPRKGTKFKLAIDIEAKECIPICIGIAFDQYEGLTIPLWNVDGHSTIPDSDLSHLWLLLAELLYDCDILPIGQNFKYDQDKIERLGFGIRKLYSDTLLKGFAINPELPKNLAFYTSIYTEEPFYKNEGMYEGSLEELFLGCARDACCTFEVESNMDRDLDELHMRDFYNNFLMRLHDSYLKTENIGFRVNHSVRDELLRKYITWTERLNYKLFEVAGAIINVNSPKQVSSLLYENFKIPSREGTGEEVLTQLLSNTVKRTDHRRAIEIILEKRRVDKTINTYLMALPDYDGRMKTTYFLCLETGRTSTGQQDPPIRPWIRIPKRKYTVNEDGEIITKKGKKSKAKKKENSKHPEDRAMGIAFQTMTKHGDIGNDIRSMFIPDPGEVFINIDSSQAEARVVFLLANDEQALYDIDHHDYHALTASWFFGGSEDDWSKSKWGYEHPVRFCGKTLRHACHLGASKNRAALTVNTDARKYKIKDSNGDLFNISEKFAGEAIRIFHAKQPSIQKNFHAGIQSALSVNKRRLIAGLPYGIESETGGTRIFYDKWGDELFRQAYSYIPQRTVSDNTKSAKLRIEDKLRGIKIILESHDALLLSCRINEVTEVARVGKEEMEKDINFTNCSLPRRKLSIPAEVEIGDNYMEFQKFKEVINA
jgi:uracil-DNA glycosylase family 4